jgi:predicted phage terminase large subunit-like protein
MRHVRNPDFGGVIFRRTGPEIRNEGGLSDESQNIYPYFGAWARETTLEWFFPSGAKMRFAHLEHEQDKYSWQGAQVAYFGFDELTHYTETQFFYLLSRNRSTSGVRPYVRCGTNPHALSWVKGFLSPWLEGPHEERAASGELRWFIRDGGEILWVPEGTPHALSVTFVRASVYDNRILLEKNPEYLAWLMAQTPVERARLLEGDWDIVEAGNFFDRAWFPPPVPSVPKGVKRCRFWDMAASKPRPGYTDPDWTVGLLMAKDENNEVYIEDVQRIRDTPLAVEQLILSVSATDRSSFGSVEIVMEQEPGSSGVIVTDSFRRKLAGYPFVPQRSTGDKRERAKPLSSYAQGGHVKLVAGHWNHDLLNEFSAFPTPGVHDDRVDAASGAFARLTGKRVWAAY